MNFSESILDWYDAQNEQFPWRNISNPYHTWVSEIMLQQTQVKTVIPYFNRWIKKFPTIKSVAIASDEEIFKYWEGLGYYSRALNLRNACLELTKLKSNLFNTSEKLIELKGIGEYTAAAIASIAFNENIPAIDGNVKRIVSRLLCINHTNTNSMNKMKDFLKSCISYNRPGDFNQAMMDLGRKICVPRKPRCTSCPIQQKCKAFKNSKVELFPMKNKIIKKIPHYNVAVGVIWKKGKILITKRKKNQLLGGLWEFPGGKIQGNESSKECIAREIKEELGIDISVNEYMLTVKHQYSHFKITLDAYMCNYVKGKIRCIEVDDYKWITPDQISLYPFPKANHYIFPKILENGTT